MGVLKYELILMGTVCTQLLRSVLNWRKWKGWQREGWYLWMLIQALSMFRCATITDCVLECLDLVTVQHCQNFHHFLLTRQSWRWGARLSILSHRWAVTGLRKIGFLRLWHFILLLYSSYKKVTSIFLSSLRMCTSNSRNKGLHVMPNLVAYLAKVAMRDSEQ